MTVTREHQIFQPQGRKPKQEEKGFSCLKSEVETANGKRVYRLTLSSIVYRLSLSAIGYRLSSRQTSNV